MKNDIPFNPYQRTGAKVVSQQEWNSVVGALSNINLGDNNFGLSSVSRDGIELDYDSFFYAHVASIDQINQGIVIGRDRSETFYPFTDTLGVQQTIQTITYVLTGGEYEARDISSTSNIEPVQFPTAQEHTPTAPATAGDPVIVGYEWHLEPTVTDVSFNGDNTEMTVTVTWTPGATFTSDSQASVIDKDVENGNSQYWSTWSEIGIDFSSTKEAQINAFLSPDSITLADDTSSWPYIDMFAPVARVDFDIAKTKLTRIVQLWFDDTVTGVTLGGAAEGVGSGFDHPFKARVDTASPTYIQIGYLRPTWKDWITIEDPIDDNDSVIEFTAQESIELDTPGSSNYYVYYDIWYDSDALPTAKWVADLEKSTTWPPLQEAAGSSGTSTGNMLIQIGYAEWDSGADSYVWYQHMYECPTIQPASIRGEFFPMYLDDGNVRIFAGSVDTFNNDTGSVAEDDFDLSTDTYIWVEVVSVKSSGDPSVTVTGTLQSGAVFPGLYERIDATTHNFNYLIGQILDEAYIPLHTGKLQIDNTLLMPDLSENYCVGTDTPRMIAFNDAQAVSVGVNTNDQLIDAEFLELEVVGGGVQKIAESTIVEMYGKSEDSTYTPIAVTGVDGTAAGTGSITITGTDKDYDFDYGLMQDFSDGSETDAVIAAGTNVQIDYAAGTGTITVPTTSITVVTQVQLDASNNLQIKTRTLDAINPGTESSWTTVTGWSTTACP